MSRATTIAIVTVLATGIVGVSAYAWVRGEVGPVAIREHCEVTVSETSFDLDLDQAENAATIVSVAGQRALPARAVTIALATAMQESKLHNLDHGDRDSLGLFQQRPSQGWGTAEQVQDPVYAAGAFYDQLVKVAGYQELEITEAAQQVQRSAYPAAYADHEGDARALASALTGNSPATFACSLRPAGVDEQAEGADGLTDRARLVRDELTGAFGSLSLGGFQPGGLTSGHMDGSAHYEGRAIDVFFEPVGGRGTAQGWAAAQWLVAHADRLDVATVIYDDQMWTARRSTQGWRPYTPPGGATDNATLRHLDHVHVDVLKGS